MLKFKAFVYEKLGAVFMLAFVGLLLFVGFKLLGQSLFWLRNGHWQSYSILNLLRDLEWGVPGTPNFLGVQKIIDSVFAWPATIGIVGVGFLCAVIGGVLMGLGEHYNWEVQKQSDAVVQKTKAREEQEDRSAAANRSKKDFNFDQQVDDAVRRRRDQES